MDSKLDSIFRTTFRTTEKADSWLGIKRDESESGGKRKEKEEKPKEDLSAEQTPSLSVQAVKAFLGSLLAEAEKKPSDQAAAAHDRVAEHTHAAENRNPQGARAAQAYQNTARGGTPSPPAVPPPAAAAPATDVALSADEIRDIHRLMNDLDTLAARGITTINLAPADNFLQSLMNAARNALILSS